MRAHIYQAYVTNTITHSPQIDAFIASVKHVSDAYYSLTTTSVDRMEYYVDGNTHQIVQPVMEVVSYESDDIFNPTGAGYTHSAIRTDSYHINMTNPLGPFQIPGTHTSNDDNAIDTSGSTSTDLSGINLSLIRRLVEMKVTFPMVVWSVDEGGRSCHAWSVKSLWTFRVRGRIGYSVDSRVTLCNGETRETPLV